MSEKLTLQKLHIGEKRPDGEKPRMSKKLKKASSPPPAWWACAARCGRTDHRPERPAGRRERIRRQRVRHDRLLGDTSNTSGMVTTDKLQKIYISQSQTVKKVWVKEGDSVKKGTALVSYDSTLTQATV